MSGVASIPLAIVFTVLQFISFLFVVVATPLPMFRSKNEINFGGAIRKQCITLWGVTRKCNGDKYFSKNTAAFGCHRRRDTMHCGAAFSIISIFTTLVGFILGLMLSVKVIGAVAPFIFSLISLITLLISWACVAGVMTEHMCGTKINGTKIGGSKYSTAYHYGSGFGLLVTAWCLEVVEFILIIVCLVI